ncbi:hypothetical protein M0P48_02685 [Candidatus Gracilibacteria bacterium]|nr:hypothetical protein [Candidatus Gracilibacteria bacterium]
MVTIITTTHVQQKIGEIAKNIDKTSYIVTNKGEGKVVMLPYFHGCDELIAEYIEDYEMFMNRKSLDKKYKQSVDSGKSDLVIGNKG